MLFRRNVICLAVMSLVLGSTAAFSQEIIPEHKNSFDLNATRELKERLPNFPKKKVKEENQLSSNSMIIDVEKK